jgi:dTDP-4-amino-4,6-dideoxygalactose transaminase
VIKDAAQAIGATYEGGPAGSIGDLGYFSFLFSKCLGSYGDGRMVTALDASLADRVRLLRAHRVKPTYFHKYVGCKFLRDALQAGVVRATLLHIEAWHAAREGVAALYDRLLDGCPGLETPRVVSGRRHIYDQYVARIAAGSLDEGAERLTEAGVETAIYYLLTLHVQEYFASLGFRPGPMLEFERATAETPAMPMYPFLSTAQIEYVVATLSATLRELMEARS